MRSITHGCVILFLFAAIMPSLARAQASPATLTKEQILSAVVAERAKIQDLTVSYSFNATHSQPDDPVFRQHDRVAMKGPMLRIERQCSPDPARGGKTDTREVSYDGRICVLYMTLPRASAIYSASKSRGIMQECTLYDLGFFINGLLAPPPNDDKNTFCPWLPSLLKRSDARLLDKLEVIDGSPCYVVEIGHPGQGGGLSQKLWLDPSQGFMPLKVFTYANGSREPDIETYVDKSLQIIPGVWLPLHGRRVHNTEITDQNGGLDSKPHPSISEYMLEVDGWDTDHPALQVNTGIKDEHFDLRPDLPAKTLLIDMDAQKN